jgi:hypothetical protein
MIAVTGSKSSVSQVTRAAGPVLEENCASLTDARSGSFKGTLSSCIYH